MTPQSGTPDQGPLWLCLSGGNALGAYQAGFYEVLHAKGLTPAQITGASIGAINGALIAGNPPDRQIPALKEFWEIARQVTPATLMPGMGYLSEKRMSVVQTLLAGRPGLFIPSMPGLWSIMPGVPQDQRLFDRRPLCQTLERLIDFGRLNSGEIGFRLTAVDAETGEVVAFDTARDRIDPNHILASSAFPIVYEPIEIDGRLLFDPGLSENHPLPSMFDIPVPPGTRCLSVDLYAPEGARPATLEDVIGRAENLIFACQTERSLNTLRPRIESSGARLLHITYSGAETGLKAFDYSTSSLARRWKEGAVDAERAVEALRDLPSEPGIHRLRHMEEAAQG